MFLRYARSKVDFAIAEDVCMIPSNTLLKIGNIEGYNNKLLIADSNVKIGMVNIDINQKLIEKEPSDTGKQLPQETSSKSENPHEHEGTSSKSNDLSENEKKIIKRTDRGERSLINIWCDVNTSRDLFFSSKSRSFFLTYLLRYLISNQTNYTHN